MGKTLDAIENYADNPDESVISREHAQGLIVTNVASVMALKVADVMMKSAGGRIAEDVWHRMPASNLRNLKGIKNVTKDELIPIFSQLRHMEYRIESPLVDDQFKISIGGLLDTADISFSGAGEALQIEWRFSSLFQRIARKSDHWAILDRQTLFNLRSKYSYLLFQHLSSLFRLKHVYFKEFEVDYLRAIMNVPESVNKEFKDFNRQILKPSLKDISGLSRYTLDMETVKSGRKVTAVKIFWEEKEDRKAVKKELDSTKLGRKARMSGKVEATVLDSPFPSSGGFSDDSYWLTELRNLWPEWSPKMNNSSTANIAEHVRKLAKEQGMALDSPKIKGLFANIIKRWGKG